MITKELNAKRERDHLLAQFVKECIIYIPTRGRAGSQITFNNIKSPALRSVIRFVCPTEERNFHPRDRQSFILPCLFVGIGPTRQWILEQHPKEKPYAIMADDDMRFFHRTSTEDWHLIKNTVQDTEDMFLEIHAQLKDYIQVGVSPRQGNNRVEEIPYKDNTRMFNFHAYDVKTFLQETRKSGLRFDATEFMEDFHVTLSILRMGYANRLLTYYCWDQSGSNTPGGCSLYRSPERQAAAARTLAELHPEFVTVVEKENKNWRGEGFNKRVDVRVQWRKAYESAKQVD